MPKLVALDKIGRTFEPGDTVHCKRNNKFGVVVKMAIPSENPGRLIWVQTPGHENFSTYAHDVVMTKKKRHLF
jgi:hypothetical protein